MMQRRSLLKAAAASPLVLGLGNSLGAATDARPWALCNEDFYTEGKFDQEKAKDGVLALCGRFGYPVFPGLREGLWVSDYGTGQYARLGLAAYMFANRYDDGDAYMMLDLFLLPGQMLPEHWHAQGDHGITKNEGWLVRWGTSYIVGIGEENLASFPQIKIPEFHCKGTASVRHVIETTPGIFVPLAASESRHWQYGGPEGAIVTEVANFHTNSATRHSDPALDRYFLES